MSRQKTVTRVVNDLIKNVHPDTNIALSEYLLHDDTWTTQKDCRARAAKFLGIEKQSGKQSHTLPVCSEYWEKRGWNQVEAEVKARIYRKNRKKSISPFSREFWMSRINPDTDKLFTIEEADFKRNSQRPIRPEYWVIRGYNEHEAQKLAIETKDKNNKKGANNLINPDVKRYLSERCIEYWIIRGYSEEQAKIEVSNVQRTFSLDICQQKHGEEVGREIWEARQDKWQKTLNSKPKEELLRINRLKVGSGSNISKGELKLLAEIRNTLPEAEGQYVISENQVKMYQYDIRVGNKLIEYNGDYWHMNPLKYQAHSYHGRMNKLAEDIWNTDFEKIVYAKNRNYTVLTIWEHDYKTNPEGVIKECIKFLTK
jgi:hypothetical protein